MDTQTSKSVTNPQISAAKGRLTRAIRNGDHDRAEEREADLFAYLVEAGLTEAEADFQVLIVVERATRR